MRNSFLIIFIVFSACGLSYGQTTFGIKSGVNFSKTTLDPQYKTKTGYNAGLISEIKLHQKLFLRPELIYSLKGARTPATPFNGQGNLHLHYLNLPVLLGFQPGKKISLLIGPEFGYLINATSKFDEKTLDRTFIFEKWDLGAALGAAYKISPKLSADARYIYGFGLLVKGPVSDNTGLIVNETYSGANRVFQLNFSYFFIRK